MGFNSLKWSINKNRLISRIKELGQIGRDEDNRLTRLAVSDADKAGRDAIVDWMKEANLEVIIDRIGNVFGIWSNDDNKDKDPIMVGSHIDTVMNAGIYDGCYGVISGIEVIKTLKEEGFIPSRPIIIGIFTNEEGVRYQPDMMGSLVYAGGLSVDKALATVGIDGTLLGEELDRIGYLGEAEPGFIQPHAYVELHVEQGPILEKSNTTIGVVEGVQGISWQRITIEGIANHAGTTPIDMRQDAGIAAAKVMTFLRDRVKDLNDSTVVTVGCIEFKPNAINVVPSQATFTVDLRNPDEERLKEEEDILENYLEELAHVESVAISTEKLVRFEPVSFDENIAQLIENSANRRGLKSKRMISGAGHDAQMIARICPTAMIFVPSVGGISHNPKEYTPETDLVAGANVLLDVIIQLVELE
ncbi:MAG TPA: Zn-dependent hydrolase [Tepidimicrobium sp.]|nr:Zn-dependent hydrolase [Tepidimicrobium sp.]